MKGTAWEDARAKRQHDEKLVAEIDRELADAERAHRLGEIRKAHGLTQTQVAVLLKVSQPNVSQVESADLMSVQLGTVRGYIEALGGTLRVVADFGDEQITVTP